MIVIGNILELLCTNVFLTGYISGNNTFPQPLDEKEEQKYLELLKAGDKKAKGVLIERNLRLVAHIVKKYQIPNKDIDELISIGTVGLIKAIDSFDASKGTRLATYASRCIENEILMYLRKNNKKKIEVSFDEPLNIDVDGNELLLSDVLGTENDEIYKIIEEEIDKDLLVMALDRLSDREKQIMELRFGLTTRGRERTQKEVATMLGISQSYISRLEKKIISRLKKEMKKFV